MITALLILDISEIQQSFSSNLLSLREEKPPIPFSEPCEPVEKIIEVEKIVEVQVDSDSNNERKIISEETKVKRIRTIIAAEVPATKKGPREFLTMLFPSWEYVNSKFNELSLVQLDLWAACENEACAYLPIECREFKSSCYQTHVNYRGGDIDNRPLRDVVSVEECQKKCQEHPQCFFFTFKSDGKCWLKGGSGERRDVDAAWTSGPKWCDHHMMSAQTKPSCWFNELPVNYIDKWKELNYLFMTSVEFGAQEPFRSVVPYYDYIIRVDVDAFVTPRILQYIPPNDGGSFSYGFMGTDFTKARLRDLAEEWGLRHQNVTGMQSTWYINAKYYIDAIEKTSKYAQKLLETQWLEEICDQLMEENGKKICGWANWHRGVVSLYASELALNDVIDDFNDSFRTKLIDVAVTRHVQTSDVILAHNIHTHLKDGDYHKFPFHKNFNFGWEKTCEAAEKEYDWRKRVREGKLNDYCRDISWSAVHHACGLKGKKFKPKALRRFLLDLDA